MNENDPFAPLQSDDKGRPEHAAHAEAAIRAALASKGITAPKHAKVIAETLQVSANQARRKLREGVWSLHDLLVLQARHGVSLMDALSTAAPVESQNGLEPAVLLMNGRALDCEIRVGELLLVESRSGLCCSKVAGRWLVSTQDVLTVEAPGEPRHGIESLQLFDSGSSIRIAVLDDDEIAASSLADYFSLAGYPSRSFNTIEELETAGLDNFDVFVLDVVLPSGTSYDLARRIREVDRDAGIMLLTGKLRGNAPMEDELARVVSEQRVDLAEKPMSPQLILASIKSSAGRRSAGSFSRP